MAESRQARSRAGYRISVITELFPKILALGETLSAWLTDRMAELGLTVEQAEKMTARQFPMTLESLVAERNPDPKESPDDVCADCGHSRDDHDSSDASCAAETSSYYGEMSPCECDTFTETELTRR